MLFIGVHAQMLRFPSFSIGFVLDKCLLCPGVAELLELSGTLANFDVQDTVDMLQLTGWNLRDISQAVGGPFTFFASVRPDVLSEQYLTRFKSNNWPLHRLEYLKSLMVAGKYSPEDLYRIYREEEGPYNLTTINGDSLLVDYIRLNDTLRVGGGDLVISNLQAVDG